MVKNQPAMQEFQETQVRSLGGEDPLEKGMATHSSILDWRIPWTEVPGGLYSMGSQKSWTWLSANTFLHLRLRMIFFKNHLQRSFRKALTEFICSVPVSLLRPCHLPVS